MEESYWRDGWGGCRVVVEGITYRVCGFLGAGPFGQRGHGLDGEVSPFSFSRALEGSKKSTFVAAGQTSSQVKSTRSCTNGFKSILEAAV